jgi:hypothetical protein
MNDATTIPPMPDTNCPSWCASTHEDEWVRHVGIICNDWRIPQSDGTYGYHEAQTIEEASATFKGDEIHHQRPLYHLGLGGTDGVTLDLQAGDDDRPTLYLDAQGSITPDQARSIAGALIEAAATMETLG